MGPVVHVAGTNGKGSTCAYLRSIAEAAGLSVNVLTSPHLVRFCERIRIHGELIADNVLSSFIEAVEAANAGEPISFFEITTALAFHAFAQRPADLNVVEVGLGGRFDATNVFSAPAACVITPVDLDHLEMLGPTLSKIAWEKAGILKKGAPAILARQRPEAETVILAEAEEVGAPATLMGREFDACEELGGLTLRLEDRLLQLPRPSLPGAHQADNAGLAAAALLALGDERITEAAIGRGVCGAIWPARFQRLSAGPLARMAQVAGADLWLDGGHNPHAAAALARTCAEMSRRDGRPWALVVGMLARKDPAGFLAPFAPLAPRLYTAGFSSQGAAPPDAIAAAAMTVGLEAAVFPDATAALAEALSQGGPAPHVLICGSLHLAGDVLALSPETWPR